MVPPPRGFDNAERTARREVKGFMPGARCGSPRNHRHQQIGLPAVAEMERRYAAEDRRRPVERIVVRNGPPARAASKQKSLKAPASSTHHPLKGENNGWKKQLRLPLQVRPNRQVRRQKGT